ncbi:MAG: hypothetical protein GY830_08775 [Bacteroidetes bacterium]|nr:hypothetical protein [Bacteroidota bacterium]
MIILYFIIACHNKNKLKVREENSINTKSDKNRHYPQKISFEGLLSDSDEDNFEEKDEKEVSIKNNYHCKQIAISYKKYLNDNTLVSFPGLSSIGSYCFRHC